MLLRTIATALLAIGLAGSPLQAQTVKAIAVHAPAEHQPFAYVADLSSHGFATASFVVDSQKRLVIEELDAYTVNPYSVGATFVLTIVTNGVTMLHYISSTVAPGFSTVELLIRQQARYYADAGSTVGISQFGVYSDSVKFQISGYEVNA